MQRDRVWRGTSTSYLLGVAAGTLVMSPRPDAEPAARPQRPWSSRTGSGYSSSATSCCFRACSPRMRCCNGDRRRSGGASSFFVPTNIAIETACLLLSSFTQACRRCGVRGAHRLWAQVMPLVTGLLGVAFLVLEAKDFAELVEQGFGPQRSAFLSSFFAVVTSAACMSCRLLWLGTMMARIRQRLLVPTSCAGCFALNLFWHRVRHHLVALFTIVYLIGEGR